MKTKPLIFLTLIAQSTMVQCVLAQSPLDEYIRLGLENNLSLKQKEISYQRSLEVLKEAKGLFYPNIGR